ncbi:hypothetical protein VNO78_32212 [Psophocarpus tetragonolobus]|uniref:Uncharacterized protein n=1 Tax=Psophocarpus tetragonolobus TaxID=3891 RepID=A0AAN9NVL9_PSOTE
MVIGEMAPKRPRDPACSTHKATHTVPPPIDYFSYSLLRPTLHSSCCLPHPQPGITKHLTQYIRYLLPPTTLFETKSSDLFREYQILLSLPFLLFNSIVNT